MTSGIRWTVRHGTMSVTHVNPFSAERSNRLVDTDKNSSAFIFCRGCLVFGFCLLLCLSLCFGHIQSKNEVAPLQVVVCFLIGQDRSEKNFS